MTIHDAVTYYKENMETIWIDEKDKWAAVKHFQNKWDIDAKDFAEMLKEAFRLADTLLKGGMYYPYVMICRLAKQDPEKMRGLFSMLYNEELSLVQRLQPFRSGCDEIMEE